MAKRRDPMEALQGATSIGADPMSRENWLVGEMPLGPGQMATQAARDVLNPKTAAVLQRMFQRANPGFLDQVRQGLFAGKRTIGPSTVVPPSPSGFESFIESILGHPSEINQTRQVLRLRPVK